MAALLTAAITGHLVGVAYAEVALRRPSGGSASLRPRVLSDYLNPRAQQAQRRAATFAALVAVAAGAVPMPESPLVSTSARVTVLAAVPVVLVSVEALERWLIRRPQPVVSQALLRADDAIRCHSVHSVAGAALGLLWVLAGLAMWTLAVSDVQILRWTMWIGALAAWGTAVGSVTLYDHGVWQRRRAPEARAC